MMDGVVAADRCLLCDRFGRVRSAGFRQHYQQLGRKPVLLSWWECRDCRGWFASPVPTVEEIELHCTRSSYNDPSQATAIAQGKEALQRRILSRLGAGRVPGRLLDIGCSFGEFMALAKAYGWTPSGFEPNAQAAEIAASKGCEVKCGWVLEQAGFPAKQFSAITAIDSFCFVWNPYETIQTFYRLLEPGGVLTMRLTNKRFVLGVARALSSRSSKEARLSRMLQGQFHSISVHRLASICSTAGFESVTSEPWAATTSWNEMSPATKVSYALPQLVYRLSVSAINLSPGVLVFARKGK